MLMDYTECVQYVAALLRQVSGLPEEKRQRFLKMVKLIQKRLENPYLHTALIGDFSTGKSTFINALIKRELLKTAWCSTTAIPTLIYYHDQDDVQILIETYDGKRYTLNQTAQRVQLAQKLNAEIPAEPREAIALLSTTNEFADTIKYIRVRTSGFEGLRHICIIDTPGVNPGGEEARYHVKRTQDVLRKYADATIVLFQAERVYTASFQKFLKENAEHLINDALFVVTMMDLVDRDERQEVMEFAKGQLKQAFGLEHPRVYGCCARAALANRSDDESRFWAESFDRLREEVAQYITQSRRRIIHRQIVTLLTQLLQELKAEVTSSMTAIENRKKALEKNSLLDLKRELDETYRYFCRDVRALAKNVQAKKEYDGMFQDILRSAEKNISACTKAYGDGRDSIEGYLKTFFPKDMKRAQDKLSDRLNRKFEPIIQAQKRYYVQCQGLFRTYQAAVSEAELPEVNQSSMNAGTFLMPEVQIRSTLNSQVSIGIVNFIGQFGMLDRYKEKTMKEIREALEAAQAENQTDFYQKLKGNGEQVLLGAKKLKDHFETEYGRIYMTQREKCETERGKLARQEQLNQEVYRKLTDYLHELKRSEV